MKRSIFTGLIAFLMAAALLGCGEEKSMAKVRTFRWTAMPLSLEPPRLSEREEEPQEEPAPDPHEGQARSYLTGEWMDREAAARRPYAIMIGNTSDALPQYGLAKADVIYEVPVEGSFTRLMALFQDLSTTERIGSIRSCRHYFVYFAREFDAIYAHYGHTVYAQPILDREDVHNISGMDGSIESVAYYRDKSRKSPHNVFTTAEGLMAASEQKGYRTVYDAAYQGHFQFASEDAPQLPANGSQALVVSPGYLVNKPWFVYNEEDGLYYRYQFKKEHIDGGEEEGNQQLKVKNILIQYCAWSNMDENGYLDIDTLGGGDGKYITNGRVMDVTWTKANEDSPARYFDSAGNEILLNPGKTWVCVVRDSYKDRFSLYNTQEELQEARSRE